MKKDTTKTNKAEAKARKEAANQALAERVVEIKRAKRSVEAAAEALQVAIDNRTAAYKARADAEAAYTRSEVAYAVAYEASGAALYYLSRLQGHDEGE